MNTDVAYSSHSVNTLFFFAYDKNISNHYVFNLLKKKKRIYFSNFFIFIINLLKNNLDPMIYREYVLDWDQLQPRFNKFYTTRPFISCLEKDINNFKLECINYLHSWDTQDYQFNYDFIIEEFDNYIFELIKIGA
jgi:hypothetical protein